MAAPHRQPDFSFLRTTYFCLLIGAYIHGLAMAARFRSGGLHHELDHQLIVRSDPSSCQPLLFVFGASMADTGEYAAAMPFTSNVDFTPYGEDYFGKPSGRWSNGRVFTDFISQALGYGFLNPYLKSVHSNFTHGANFACADSTARTLDDGYMFPMSIQVDQFRSLLSNLLTNESATSSDGEYTQQQINEAILIIETANNDYVHQFFENSIDVDLDEMVADVVGAMEVSLKDLYALGGRNFIVMSLTPIGCTPAMMMFFEVSQLSEMDEYGCVVFLNEAVAKHNKQLEGLLLDVSSELTDAKWILYDAHSIFIDGYRNPSRYGVEYPQMVCCGAGGGKYNFMNGAECGGDGVNVNGTLVKATKCDDPSQYINWDGIHPVDSFAKFMADGILTGTHLSPPFDIWSTCSSTV